MKRISLFLPLVVLLASCAQVPAVPTVTATFTAPPTQLPTATATPVPPTEILAIPTEKPLFHELSRRGTPRNEINYPLVTIKQLEEYVKKLESEETRLTSSTATLTSTINSYGLDGTDMVFHGEVRKAFTIRSDFSVQMPNGAIIHGLVIEMRTMVDGSPRRSVVVVSEENRYGGFYEMIIDGFYSGNTVVTFSLPLDLSADSSFVEVPAAEYLFDIMDGAQSPIRDRIVDTGEFYIDSTEGLIFFRIGSLGFR